MAVNESFEINSSSCALCLKYRKFNSEEIEDECVNCPIVEKTGKSCFSGYDSAWMEWISFENPQKMIDLLTLINNSI